MYVTDDQIRVMEERYGIPVEREFHIKVTDCEYERIRSSQKHGRNHDMTAYIMKGDRLVVIAKPFYPLGMYRAPSGGLKPGEDMEEGIHREVAEETGCKIELEKFLLRTSAAFVNKAGEVIQWRSFVFLARYVSGDFNFTDTEEIREVHLADPSEFDRYGRLMRESDIGGLHYRAALHEAVVKLL